MVLQGLDIAVIFLYIAVLVFIGIYFKKQAQKDKSSYLLGGEKSVICWDFPMHRYFDNFGNSGGDVPLCTTQNIWFHGSGYIQPDLSYYVLSAWVRT